MAQQILIKDDQGIFFEKGAEMELVLILQGMSKLGYRNLELIAVIHKHLLGEDFQTNGQLS
jgi:hypothetical protein